MFLAALILIGFIALATLLAWLDNPQPRRRFAVHQMSTGDLVRELRGSTECEPGCSCYGQR